MATRVACGSLGLAAYSAAGALVGPTAGRKAAPGATRGSRVRKRARSQAVRIAGKKSRVHTSVDAARTSACATRTIPKAEALS